MDRKQRWPAIFTAFFPVSSFPTHYAHLQRPTLSQGPRQDHRQFPRTAGPRAAMAVTDGESPELVESGELALHLEALQRWHDEAELLREARVLPPGADDQINLDAETRDQVKDLMETLIEEEILDVRRGWASPLTFNAFHIAIHNVPYQ
ncbi:uncharacterized protein LOC125044166 [Penaeus chinensis]|uniref:uncharacterized protein LOC125044166 n=1 Tax=Penaeus chinensis TaxID=139456 RepID=UPI001FB7F600|nr:uncharacterized protein LOC125044166 [Penaeus chinensis]